MESHEYLKSIILHFKGKRYATISQLAEMAGISQGNLSSFMKGKRTNITFDTAWRILKVLGVEFPDPSTKSDFNDSLASNKEILKLQKELYKAQGRNEELRELLMQTGILSFEEKRKIMS